MPKPKKPTGKKPKEKPKQPYSHRTPGGGAKGPIEINPKGVLKSVRKRQKALDEVMKEK